jgi:hypothetical protein
MAHGLLALAAPLGRANAPLAATPSPTDATGEPDVAFAALAALATGLLAWAALAWLPRRRPRWSVRG